MIESWIQRSRIQIQVAAAVPNRHIVDGHRDSAGDLAVIDTWTPPTRPLLRWRRGNAVETASFEERLELRLATDEIAEKIHGFVGAAA